MVAGIHHYRDVAQLVYPVRQRVSGASAVGLRGFCRAAENLIEREPEFGGAICRV
jgi:hypothetical protein